MESPLVIKLGGMLLNNNDAIKRLFKELYYYKSFNKKDIIIVNGIGAFGSSVLQQSDIISSSNKFCSISTLNTKKIISSIIPNIVNIRLLSWSKRYKMPGQPVFLPDFFKKLVEQSNFLLNIEYILKIFSKNISLYLKFIKSLLTNNITPFICSMGVDKKGNIFNINSDIVAMILTIIFKGRLIVLTDVSSVLDGKGKRIKRITSHDIHDLLKSGLITSGMTVKVKSALVVAKVLKKPVEISSWHHSDDFINLLQGRSIGTRIIE